MAWILALSLSLAVSQGTTARPALAATPPLVVALVGRRDAAPALNEALVLLQGELLSIGAKVAFVPDRAAAQSLEFNALIEIGERSRDERVGVWLRQKDAAWREVSRVALEATAPNAAERLALRTVEVLRSGLDELEVSAPQARKSESEVPAAAAAGVPAAAIASTAPEGAPSPHRERLSLELGAASWMGLGRLGLAFTPLLRVNVVLRPWLVLQGTVATFGTWSEMETSAGRARLAQEYALLGAAHRFRADHALRPFVSLAAGCLRTTAEGLAEPPRENHEARRWSLLLDAGAGTELRVHEHLSLTLGMHLQWAEPYLSLRSAGDEPVTVGRPSVLATLALGAWL